MLSKKNVLLLSPVPSLRARYRLHQGAASDKDVLAIKITLYRTGANSPIVDHLVNAARAGKEVTVIIELMARFDEAANISLANRLQEAGAHVVYGLVGYKTHAKMTLVVRRENRTSSSRYVHLGTGNYHHCDVEDLYRLRLPERGSQARRRRAQDFHAAHEPDRGPRPEPDADVAVQPVRCDHREDRARDRACRSGRKGHIIVKVNSLNEPNVVNALYEASQAGVKIDLIVRGICTLRPGVLGLSDNITVRSILGRFLEHSRVYYFHNDGDEEFYCASADWMERNLLRRNETCFPVKQKSLKEQLKRDLELYLADNTKAWELHGDGSYERLIPGDREPVSAQETFLQILALGSAS